MSDLDHEIDEESDQVHNNNSDSDLDGNNSFHMNQKTVVVTVTTHKHTRISLLPVFVEGAVGEGVELLIRLITPPR